MSPSIHRERASSGFRAESLALIDAHVDGAGILRGELPEGHFDDAGGVMFIAHHFLEAACHY